MAIVNIFDNIQMFIEHEYRVGSIVLAKAEDYPHWPAKVVTCLKNGAYKMVFLQEESEAILLPSMIRKLDHHNLQKLRKEKHSVHPGIAQDAVRITEKLLQAVEKGNSQLQQQMPTSDRRVQTRRTQLNSIEHNNGENDNSKNQSEEKDIYFEIKQLLDKLSKFSANLSSTRKLINFTKEEQCRLDKLLHKKLKPKQLVDNFVIDHYAITLNELQRWKTAQTNDLFISIKARFWKIKQQVSSYVMGNETLTALRRKRVLERLESVGLGV